MKMIKMLTFLGNKDSFKAILNSGVCNNSSFGTRVMDGNTLDVVIHDAATAEDVRSLIEKAQKNDVYLNVSSAKMLKERFGESFIPKSVFTENVEEGQPLKRYLNGEGSRENTDKIRKLTAIYNDYISIETDKDLKKRKLTLAEYQAFPSVFKRYQDNGETRTFVTAIAEYFKKYGFSVSMDENNVNFVIQ